MTILSVFNLSLHAKNDTKSPSPRKPSQAGSEDTKYYYEGQEKKKVKVLQGKGSGKSTYEIEVIEGDHPAGAPIQVKVTVKCEPDLQAEVITPENFRVCEFDNHSYDKAKDEIRISYRLVPEISCITRKDQECADKKGKNCLKAAIEACDKEDPCPDSITAVWPMCKPESKK